MFTDSLSFWTAADEQGGEGILSLCSIDKKNKAQRDWFCRILLPSQVCWLQVNHMTLSPDNFSSSLETIHVEILINADLYNSVQVHMYLRSVCSAQDIMGHVVLGDVTMGSRVFFVPLCLERLVPNDRYIGPSTQVNEETCSAILEGNLASTRWRERTK